MAEDPTNPEGRINTERFGPMLLIGIDRTHKYNSFTPKMSRELGEAYTALENDPSLHCGVLHAVGPHTTAGLDMVAVAPHQDAAGAVFGKGNIDCLGLRGPHQTKAMVMAVQGITFTLGVEYCWLVTSSSLPTIANFRSWRYSATSSPQEAPPSVRCSVQVGAMPCDTC